MRVIIATGQTLHELLHPFGFSVIDATADYSEDENPCRFFPTRRGQSRYSIRCPAAYSLKVFDRVLETRGLILVLSPLYQPSRPSHVVTIQITPRHQAIGFPGMFRSQLPTYRVGGLQSKFEILTRELEEALGVETYLEMAEAGAREIECRIKTDRRGQLQFRVEGHLGILTWGAGVDVEFQFSFPAHLAYFRIEVE